MTLQYFDDRLDKNGNTKPIYKVRAELNHAIATLPTMDGALDDEYIQSRVKLTRLRRIVSKHDQDNQTTNKPFSPESLIKWAIEEHNDLYTEEELTKTDLIMAKLKLHGYKIVRAD